MLLIEAGLTKARMKDQAETNFCHQMLNNFNQTPVIHSDIIDNSEIILTALFAVATTGNNGVAAFPNGSELEPASLENGSPNEFAD